MSDSDGSPFKGFTEAEVRHTPPTQAVDSVSIVVSPVRSTELEPHLQTPSSFRQASVAALMNKRSIVDLVRAHRDCWTKSVRSCVLNCGGAGIAAVNC